jgi:outer membrane biosynthesis protein TonB
MTAFDDQAADIAKSWRFSAMTHHDATAAITRA